MAVLFSGVAAALWLGFLTSISPCPLATNITAVSYIGKQITSIRLVVLSGILYTLGRMTAYVIVGAIVVAGVFSIPSLSFFLQRYMNMLIGPLLVIAGMALLELIAIPLPGLSAGAGWEKKIGRYGISGAFVLGFLFALTFCPVSAALFFGSLIPLSIERGSVFLLPLAYGVGTALPVMGFALIVAFGARSLGSVFEKVTVFEKRARILTGVVFICVGIFLTLRNVFQVI